MEEEEEEEEYEEEEEEDEDGAEASVELGRKVSLLVDAMTEVEAKEEEENVGRRSAVRRLARPIKAMLSATVVSTTGVGEESVVSSDMMAMMRYVQVKGEQSNRES